MKINYFLIAVLVCILGCNKYNSRNTTKEKLTTKEDEAELVELLSFDADTVEKQKALPANATSATSVENETIELVYSEYSSRECEKCDTRKVLVVSQGIENLDYQLLYDFLCTFDESCSRNVEYSEFSIDVLYKLLSKHPKAIVEIISDNPDLNSEYIYNQISSPLLDYNYNSIIKSVLKLKGNEGVKSRVVGSLKKAMTQ